MQKIVKHIMATGKITKTIEPLMIKPIVAPGLESNKNILLRGFNYGYLIGLNNKKLLSKLINNLFVKSISVAN